MVKHAQYTGGVSRARMAGELSFVFLATAAATWALTHIPGELVGDFGHLALSAGFLFGALTLARRDRRGASHYGIDLEGVLEPRGDDRGLVPTLRTALPSALRELGVALLVALVVFPPFVLLYRSWHGVASSFTLQLPSRPLDFVLSQLLVVALPEEALFRGYFQTRLQDLFASRRIAGAELCVPAVVIQAALFAALHFLVGFAPSRLAVFFPGLLFGIMRSFRGGIGAAIWFHAFSNMLSELLSRGYS
jgi:membrane protease YdiL (CAAX protease family)